MGYIYMVTCKINNKKYIGKTESEVAYRWKQHCRDSFLESHGDYNFPFHRAIRKYGIENFIVKCIDKSEDKEELKEKEKYWIQHYDTFNNGYNATLGGDGQTKYNYDEIVNYYLSNNFSITETCKHFQIYDQVVYCALKSKNINYKVLSNTKEKKSPTKKRILLVEKNIIFNNMAEINRYFGKVVHPNIRRCLNGITKKAYGFTWKEID